MMVFALMVLLPTWAALVASTVTHRRIVTALAAAHHPQT